MRVHPGGRGRASLAQLQRRLVDRDGVGDAAGGVVGGGEVVAAEDVWVIGAELRLSLLQRRLVDRDRLGDATGGPVGSGEVVAAGERVGVVGAELRLAQLQRRLEDRDRLGEAAAASIGVGKVAAAGERVGVVGAERRLADRPRLAVGLLGLRVQAQAEIRLAQRVEQGPLGRLRAGKALFESGQGLVEDVGDLHVLAFGPGRAS